MEKMLPDKLKDLWQRVEHHELTYEEFNIEQERLLTEYRNIWKRCLCLESLQDLQESLLYELSLYLECQDLSEIQQRCIRAVETLKHDWNAKVDGTDRQSIERFYDEGQTIIYELMWWHSLIED